jgi:hypothetical protein
VLSDVSVFQKTSCSIPCSRERPQGTHLSPESPSRLGTSSVRSPVPSGLGCGRQCYPSRSTECKFSRVLFPCIPFIPWFHRLFRQPFRGRGVRIGILRTNRGRFTPIRATVEGLARILWPLRWRMSRLAQQEYRPTSTYNRPMIPAAQTDRSPEQRLLSG